MSINVGLTNGQFSLQNGFVYTFFVFGIVARVFSVLLFARGTGDGRTHPVFRRSDCLGNMGDLRMENGELRIDNWGSPRRRGL